VADHNTNIFLAWPAWGEGVWRAIACKKGNKRENEEIAGEANRLRKGGREKFGRFLGGEGKVSPSFLRKRLTQVPCTALIREEKIREARPWFLPARGDKSKKRKAIDSAGKKLIVTLCARTSAAGFHWLLESGLMAVRKEKKQNTLHVVLLRHANRKKRTAERSPSARVRWRRGGKLLIII